MMFSPLKSLMTTSKTVFKFRIWKRCKKTSSKENVSTYINSLVTKVSFADLDGEILRKAVRKNMQKAASKFTVTVEGNIGSGKTTLLNYFSKCSDVEVISEPVDKWRNLDGHNLLGSMYRDPQKWSFALQSYVQLTMIDRHYREQVLPVKMLERSLYSAKYCFVENLYRTGKMSEAEYLVLTEWFQWLTENVPFSVDLIVYLQTKPEVVHKRILARSRPEEMTVPLSYLEELHELHEDWLIHERHFKLPAPVLLLDANNDLLTMYKLYEEKSKQILGTKEVQAVI